MIVGTCIIVIVTWVASYFQDRMAIQYVFDEQRAGLWQETPNEKLMRAVKVARDAQLQNTTTREVDRVYFRWWVMKTD